MLSVIPKSGRIAAVRDGAVISKEAVLATWAQTKFLRTEAKIERRGWLVATIRIVERFGSRTFSLAEVYQHSAEAAALYPRNSNVQAKLRQQLQCLRDKGFIEFLESGSYRRR